MVRIKQLVKIQDLIEFWHKIVNNIEITKILKINIINNILKLKKIKIKKKWRKWYKLQIRNKIINNDKHRIPQSRNQQN